MVDVKIDSELKSKIDKYKAEIKAIEGRDISDNEALTDICKGRKVSSEFNQKIENEL